MNTNYSNLSSYQNPEGQLNDRLAPRVLSRIGKINWRDVKGRTVLDIGCNNGEFVREALVRGATRAVGVDKSNCIIGARELAKGTKAEFWQMDVDSKEFRRFCPRFDIVFLFSVITHLKDKEDFLDWLDGIVKIGLFFESNHGEKNKRHIELVKKHIYCQRVEEIGMTDIPEKPHYMWYCERPSHEARYPSIASHETEFIPIDDIHNDKWTFENISQQEKYTKNTREHVDMLKEDISRRGVREPLLVKKSRIGYKGMNGAHRYLAAKELGYKELPCKVIR